MDEVGGDGHVTESFSRIGHFFVCTNWIQSQIVHIVAFADAPNLIERFLATPERVPHDIHLARLQLFEKNFGLILNRFLTHFRNLYSADELNTFEAIKFLRDAIAHSYVSKARPYILYRPANDGKTQKVIELFGVKNCPDDADPVMFKLDFSSEIVYLGTFSLITRADELLARACSEIGLKHSRIR